jgi:glycosyltransferase involved in cell wall biosynthesis
MKILSIVWFKVLPAKFGGQKGIGNFNQQLSRLHPLVCICSADNEPGSDTTYKVLPVLPTGKKQLVLPSAWRKIKQAAMQEKATHIILEHPYHGMAAVRAAKATGAKLIVHSHNIESERFRQIGNRWWRLLAMYEKWVHRKADLNLFKTEEDKQFAITHFGLAESKCMIIPFGIEKPVKNNAAAALIRERHSIPADHKILLFAGTLDYHPNAEAVTSIYRQLAPALSAKQFPCSIIICGRNKEATFQYLKSYHHPAVIMAAEVDDIDNYFAAADVFINPVQSGGGIQTKNLDALAFDLDIVCFDHLLQGIPASLCGNKLFTTTAGNWDEFTNCIIAASQRSTTTPAAFFDYFNWETITKKAADRIAQL